MAKFIWTKELLKQEALRFCARAEWAKTSPNSYNAACWRGWLEECCAHMSLRNKYWTDKELIEDAKLYKHRWEWQKNSKGFSVARRRKLLEKCCEHMIPVYEKWNKDSIKKEAKKFKSKKEWLYKSSASYQAALRFKIVPECITHMKPGNICWTAETVMADALKYKFRSEWSKNSSGYKTAIRMNILDKCCAHMDFRESCFTHNMGAIYMFVFSDESGYIGLSIEEKQRFNRHMTEGKIYKKLQTGIDYMYLILEDNIPNNLLAEREIFYINEYKTAGINLINKHKGGSRGKIYTKWSIANIKAHALQFATKTEWERGHLPTYNAAKRRGIYDECVKHMKVMKRSWTNEEIIADAQKFTSHKDWYSNSSSYQLANARGIKDKCVAHFKNS